MVLYMSEPGSFTAPLNIVGISCLWAATENMFQTQAPPNGKCIQVHTALGGGDTLNPSLRLQKVYLLNYKANSS